MNTIIWILQVVLASFFIMPGVGKISGSRESHITDGHIKPDGNLMYIRVLGILELLGCVGIIVPWLIGIMPILTPITAVGFCLILVAGIINHAIKREYRMLPMLTAVLVVASLVAYYRFAHINK